MVKCACGHVFYDPNMDYLRESGACVHLDMEIA
jgi:hypothetical protein